MAFQDVAVAESDTTVTLGGRDRKTGKEHPKKIEGYYLGTKGGLPNRFNPEKPTNLHIFQTEKGNVGVWGKTNLDYKMAAVLKGCMVRVTFTGTRPTNKGNDMLLYRVEVDTNNIIDVAALPSDAVESFSDDSGYQEIDADGEETAPDEIQPARPVAPRQPAQAPNAERQAKVLAALNARKA